MPGGLNQKARAEPPQRVCLRATWHSARGRTQNVRLVVATNRFRRCRSPARPDLGLQLQTAPAYLLGVELRGTCAAILALASLRRSYSSFM